MAKMNRLLESPPHPVEEGLLALGEALRTARIKRNITIAEAAERIGTGPRAVMDAEKGKPSTGIVVYAALLWLYGLLDPLVEIGDRDVEGDMLSRASARKRARRSMGLDNDF